MYSLNTSPHSQRTSFQTFSLISENTLNLEAASPHLRAFAEVTSGSCKGSHGERFHSSSPSTPTGPQFFFIQDMNRFASPFLRIIFDGADLQEESLYHVFRVFILYILNNNSLIPTLSYMDASLTSQPQLPFLAPLTVPPLLSFLIFTPPLLLAMLYMASILITHAFAPPIFHQYRVMSYVTGLLSILVSSFRSSSFFWAL
jgi:hypothetical protein